MFKLLKKEKTQKELFFQELRKIFLEENSIGEHRYRFTDKENGTFNALKLFLQTYDKYSGDTLECEYKQFGNDPEGCTITNKPHILFPNCIKEIDPSYNPEFPSVWSTFIFNYLGYSNGIEIHDTCGIGKEFPYFGFEVRGDTRFLNSFINAEKLSTQYLNLNKVWIKSGCGDSRISLPVQSIESRDELFTGYHTLRKNIESITENELFINTEYLNEVGLRLEQLILNNGDKATANVRQLSVALNDNTFNTIKELNSIEYTRVQEQARPHILTFDSLLGKYL